MTCFFYKELITWHQAVQSPMPEDQNIEWKKTWRDEYLKWICGFANAQGGRIYIGMDDDGNVTGVADYRQLMEDIPNKTVSVLGIMPEVNLLEKNGLYYIEINVAPSTVPVNYKGEYHYRCGSTRQQLKGAALNDFLLRKTGTRWDAVHLHNVNAENLDGASFDIFRRAAKSSGRLSEEDLKAAPAELLERLHLAENGVLTRAAALLFHPNPDWVNPGCYVKIGRFSKGSNLLYHDEIQGSLIRLADEVIRTLYLKYFKAHITYKNDVRIERYPYPRAAVREIFFNALVHNNWSDNIPIQIRVDDDKLVISNSCVLPWGWTVNDLTGFHSSRPFNPLIANTFFRAGYIESWGRGISTVLDICLENAYPTPQFVIRGEDMSVIFPVDPSFIGADSTDTPQNLPAKLPSKQTKQKALRELVLAAMGKDPKVSQQAIAEHLNVGRSTVQRIVKSLMDEGLLFREGGKYNGKWIIK